RHGGWSRADRRRRSVAVAWLGSVGGGGTIAGSSVVVRQTSSGDPRAVIAGCQMTDQRGRLTVIMLLERLETVAWLMTSAKLAASGASLVTSVAASVVP